MTTPDKYKPEPREYEDKDWLVEKYWGELKSTPAIAEETPVSPAKIQTELERHNIPRRVRRYAKTNSVSPFSGFYNGNESAQSTEEANTVYDDEFEHDDDLTLEWEKIARKDDAVGSDGQSDQPLLGD